MVHFPFVHESDYSKTIETNGKSVALLIQKVMECGHFAAQYIQRTNFSITTAKHAISDIDTRFTEYESKFEELKRAFVEGAALHADITVFP